MLTNRKLFGLKVSLSCALNIITLLATDIVYPSSYEILRVNLHDNNCTKNGKDFPFILLKDLCTDNSIVKTIPVHTDP